VHSTAEELSEYLWQELVHDIGLQLLRDRKIEWMEVVVKESPTQGASFKKRIL
jgi:hypothetical protein